MDLQCAKEKSKQEMEGVGMKERVQQAMAQLDEKGYGVVPGVLSDEQCQSIRGEILENLQKASKGAFQANKPRTWNNIPRTRGIVMLNSISHCRAVWECRKACFEAFSLLWSTEDLLCSFDRINIMTPELDATDDPTLWLHVDQSVLHTQRLCVQGLLDLEGTDGHNDGGLLVCEGSHLHMQHWQQRASRLSDFVPLDAHQKRECLQRFPAKKIASSRGSLVLWDSRTVHCNVPPAMKGNAARNRLVVYVCMMPKSHVGIFNNPNVDLAKPIVETMLRDEGEEIELVQNVLAKRVEAYHCRRSTSHWPVRCVLFGKDTGDWDWSTLNQPKLEEDTLVASLVGLNQDEE